MSYDMQTTHNDSWDFKAAENFAPGTIGFLKENGAVVLRAYGQLIELANPENTYSIGGTFRGPLMRAAAPGFTVTLKVKA